MNTSPASAPGPGARSEPLVDVHHHWTPDAHFHGAERWLRPGEEVRRADGVLELYRDGLCVLPNQTELLYRADAKLAAMDAANIRTAVLHGGNWIEWLTMENCRQFNDATAELVRRYPDRFVGLAHVPAVAPGALDEMARGVQELGFRGIAIGCHLVPERLMLDAPAMRPFWQRADALGVPIVMHPTLPLEYEMLADYNLINSVGRTYSVTVAVMRLLLSGLMDEYPNLRFVLPHLGGTFFALRERLVERHLMLGGDESARPRLVAAMERFYFDTAPGLWPASAVRHAVEQLGAEHVLFGSDYPIQANFMEAAVAALRGAGFTPAVEHQVGRANATRLFGLGADN